MDWYEGISGYDETVMIDGRAERTEDLKGEFNNPEEIVAFEG